ncbi:MAG: polysaccharide deacetylase family protein [Clostridia bacterium]|nr:polysaccharide deacetylase family protein [Clostridia bacterium]
MKYRIFGKKQLLMAALLIIWAAVLITVIILTASDSVSAKQRKLPVYSVETNEKKIALTFNAAWGDETTDDILSILRENGVRATFFIVGTFADKYPESVKKIYNAGHELGSHSLRHRDPVKQSFTELTEDMSASCDLIFSLTGAYPLLYRAPSGSYDDKTVEAAEELGMTAVQWSADSVDWKNPSPEDITKRVLKRAAPGGIVLFHLGKENTASALPGIIESLKADGYTFVTVSELLIKGGSFIDQNGVQRPAPIN